MCTLFHHYTRNSYSEKNYLKNAFLLFRVMTQKIIIDCDTGVDDAQAIMMAFSSPDVEVVAITCVSGNTDVDNVCRNTLRVLKVCEHREVSIGTKKQKRSTDGCWKLKKSVDMTSSGMNGLNMRTNASPIWDRTRCPEELASSVG